MGSITVSAAASMVLIATYYLLILGTLASAETSSNPKPLLPPPENLTPHFRTRGGLFAAPRRLSTLHRAKPVQEMAWIIDEDEDSPFSDVSKRFDDYGHMRFGKRGAGEGDQFDDYGHMRFGRRKRSSRE
ncbi:uncharacterized protein LOC132260048 [Phlebotomus argentipes]|uniref:uncharacterized protein LOC132260048 n=1 Tax=Phlebotomus argentipes TaxID=94469 RepID=UPI0028932A0B|nr:uncharacterized protein LOC132260048 [Phlebotomus argentipes]